MGWLTIALAGIWWEWLGLRGRHAPLSYYVRKVPKSLLWGCWLWLWGHFLR